MIEEVRAAVESKLLASNDTRTFATAGAGGGPGAMQTQLPFATLPSQQQQQERSRRLSRASGGIDDEEGEEVGEGTGTAGDAAEEDGGEAEGEDMDGEEDEDGRQGRGRTGGSAAAGGGRQAGRKRAAAGGGGGGGGGGGQAVPYRPEKLVRTDFRWGRRHSCRSYKDRQFCAIRVCNGDYKRLQLPTVVTSGVLKVLASIFLAPVSGRTGTLDTFVVKQPPAAAATTATATAAAAAAAVAGPSAAARAAAASGSVARRRGATAGGGGALGVLGEPATVEGGDGGGGARDERAAVPPGVLTEAVLGLRPLGAADQEVGCWAGRHAHAGSVLWSRGCRGAPVSYVPNGVYRYCKARGGWCGARPGHRCTGPPLARHVTARASLKGPVYKMYFQRVYRVSG